MRSLPEWSSPSAEIFREEIAAKREPAILRGVGRRWPLAGAAKQDPRSCMEMLAANSSSATIEILRADPGEEGRFHYSPDGRSLNFIRGRATLPIFLAALEEQASEKPPFAMVAQGALAERYLPGFRSTHPMPL